MKDDHRTPAERETPRRHPLGILLLLIGWSVGGVLLLLLTVIAVLFLYVGSVPAAWMRILLAAIYVMAVLGLFFFTRPRWRAAIITLGLFGLIMLWFALIPASNDRHWQPDVARVASVAFDGDLVTITNVRNFRYRTLDDFDEAWDVRTYDLSTIESLDIFFSYWGPKEIAHTMLSWGFANGDHLALSVETRKEVGETYDPLRSFFKQFELIYIFGDERDLVGQRTDVRLEDTYLFPMRQSPEERRALLEDMLRTADELGREPRYYATIKHNCTTTLIHHIDRVEGRRTPFSFKLLFNGYIPEMAYERGLLPGDAPFEEVLQRFAISAKARAAGLGDDFSAAIRVGLGQPPGGEGGS